MATDAVSISSNFQSVIAILRFCYAGHSISAYSLAAKEKGSGFRVDTRQSSLYVAACMRTHAHKRREKTHPEEEALRIASMREHEAQLLQAEIARI